MKFLHIEKAQHIANYEVWLEFNDGSKGKVNLKDSIHGRIFEPLSDTEFFKKFRLEGHTLSWPNGADFAPEYLKAKIIEQTNGVNSNSIEAQTR